MPPISEDEASRSSSEEQIPAKEVKLAAGGEGDDEGEENEDEYVVETIIGHKVEKGTIFYDVKWQGYEDPKDRTWEEEDNLATAPDILQEYFERIGGKPEVNNGKKRKIRKSGAASESATPASSSKRSKYDSLKKEQRWEPPKGSWEHEVSHVETVEQRRDEKTGEWQKFGYLSWKNGKKTQHPLSAIYNKCPQRMLAYYEAHLVFNNAEEINGEEDTNIAGVDA